MKGSRILDDLGGLAGGALSVVVGLKDECRSFAQARRELMLQRLDVARGAEVEAVRELASRAMAEVERLAARFSALEERLATLEQHLAAQARKGDDGGTGPGMEGV
jgi:BMFP domain-containing protein YqiC